MERLRPSTKFVIGLSITVGVVILCLYWDSRSNAPTRRWPPYGEPVLIDAPLYKQSDPEWADDAMGDSGETIHSAGCTLCSAAMLLSYYGVPVTPGELNRYLARNGGYASRALLVWDKCVDFSDGQVRMQYYGPPTREIIEKNLAAHNPVIVKVYIHGRIAHWVLLVGTNGPDYLANDPAGSSATPVNLSTFGDRMYALRVFAKAGPDE